LAQEVLRPLGGSSWLRPSPRRLINFDLFHHPRYFRGRHHAAAILVVALLAVLAFKVFPLQRVTVLSEGRAVQVTATFDGHEAALEAAALDLAPGDRLLVGRVGDQAALAVRRATPVTIAADGASFELRTQAKTVAGALAAAGLKLRDQDRVFVDGLLATATAQLASAATASSATPLSSGTQSLHIEVVRARPITVVVDRLRIETRSAAATVEGVIADLGLRVREGDLVSPGLETPVSAGSTIRLAQAKTITVVVDGQAEALYTRARSVEDVIALFDFELLERDTVSHEPRAIVIEGMEIVVSLVREFEEEEIEFIPPQVISRSDHTLAPGEERVITGVPGERLVRYQVTYESGVEIGRERLGDSFVKAAIPTEHLIGPASEGGSPVLVSDGVPVEYKEKVRVWATWYNATHGEKDRDDPAYGITATGILLVHGICAVDPTVIPLGTRFYVPGYGHCLAADVGGLIKGYDVDLGFPEEAGDNPWYTGYVEIYILD